MVSMLDQDLIPNVKECLWILAHFQGIPKIASDVLASFR